MSSKRDYYEVLGVARGASADEIRQAYRALARRYHPDVSQEPGAEDRFKEINEAYEVLSDSEKRTMYDRFGHSGPGAGFGGFGDFGARDPFDIFEEVFGGFGFRTGGQRRPRRGADLRYDLRISFEEAVFGTQKEIEIARHEVCPTCQGSGAEPGTTPVRCSECAGSGQVRRVQRSILGSFVNVMTCPVCNGSGEVITTPCSTCRGERRVYRSRRLKVTIPAGVDSGMRVRVSGEGEPGELNGPPGNLYVVLEVEPHPFFRRREDDVVLELQVNVAQAALGTEVTVPTLEGEERLAIPPGTQSGARFVLRGKGVPHVNRNGRGDQWVLVQVQIPTKLTKHQRELLKQLGETLEGELVLREEKGFLDQIRELLGL